MTGFAPLTKLPNAAVDATADVDVAGNESAVEVLDLIGDVEDKHDDVVVVGTATDIATALVVSGVVVQILVVGAVVPTGIELLLQLLFFNNVTLMIVVSINEAGDIDGLARDEDGDEQSLWTLRDGEADDVW